MHLKKIKSPVDAKIINSSNEVKFVLAVYSRPLEIFNCKSIR